MYPIEGRFATALFGDIARIRALSVPESKNKKAAFDEKTAFSAEVVAGAGFEPATFRL